MDLSTIGSAVPKPTTFAALFPTASAVPTALSGELPDFSSPVPTITLAATNEQVSAINGAGVRHLTGGDPSKIVTVVALDKWTPPRAAYEQSRVANACHNGLFFNVKAVQAICVGAPALLTARAPVLGAALAGSFIPKGSLVRIVAVRLDGKCLGAWPAGLPGEPSAGDRGIILVVSVKAGGEPVYGSVGETESDCQERMPHQPTHRLGYHLILSFALSIFRSQGLEFPSIYVDATGWFRSHGFLYLCLTRVRGTFENIRFLNAKHVFNFVEPSLLAFCERCEALHDSSRLLGQATAANAAVFIGAAGSLYSSIADSLAPSPLAPPLVPAEPPTVAVNISLDGVDWADFFGPPTVAVPAAVTTVLDGVLSDDALWAAYF